MFDILYLVLRSHPVQYAFYLFIVQYQGVADKVSVYFLLLVAIEKVLASHLWNCPGTTALELVPDCRFSVPQL